VFRSIRSGKYQTSRTRVSPEITQVAGFAMRLLSRHPLTSQPMKKNNPLTATISNP
jgi:hypothetical protein